MANSRWDTVPDQMLPEAVEIERMLLGGILNGSVSFPAVASQLGPDDFTLVKHRRLLSHMKDLHEAGLPMDLGMLVQRLQDIDQLRSVEGLSYLVELRSSLPSIEASVAEGWCRILRDKTSRRRLIQFANEVQNLVLSGDGEIDQLLALSQKNLSEITGTQYFDSDLQLPADIVDEYGGAQAFLQPHMGNVIPTPFDELNWKLGGGYREGEVVVIAARPSQGKSARAFQQAVFSAFHGIETVVYPLEMKARQLLLRSVASRGNLDSMLFKRPKQATEAQRIKAVQSLYEIYELPNLWINRRAEITMGRVEADLRKLKHQGRKPRLCVIDHLGLVTGMGRFENRVQEISGITRAAKRIAMQLDVCLVLLCQLNRKNEHEGRRPTLADLRDSGRIEEDADIVEFLHWHNREKEKGLLIRTVENIIAKQREGPLDTVELGFHTEYTDFRSLERGRYEEDAA